MRTVGTLSLMSAAYALHMSPGLRVDQLKPEASLRTLSLVMETEAADTETAGRAAEDMAAGRAAEDMAEMRAAQEIVKRSISRPAVERKKLLRELQVKWHPDRQYGDEASREFAVELSVMVNEAANVARKQLAAAESKRRRTAAYDVLQQQVNRGDVDALRIAIQDACNAGVSDMEVTEAESVLVRLERGIADDSRREQDIDDPELELPPRDLRETRPSAEAPNPLSSPRPLPPQAKGILGAVALASFALAGSVLINSGTAERVAAVRVQTARVGTERAVAERLAAEAGEKAALEKVASAQIAAQAALREQVAAESAEKLAAKRLAAARAAAEQAAVEEVAAESAVKAATERK